MPINLQSIGISGILAAEQEIATVESNITNASNPNYSVESVNLAARPGPDGSGLGVDVAGTQRAQAPFLGAQINQSLSSQSFYSAFTQSLQAAEDVLAPTSGGDLGQSLQDLFNSFSNLAASPEDPAVRTQVLSSASNFSQLAFSTSYQLSQLATQTASAIPSLVAQVNAATQQVADLNQQIATLKANGSSAAALMDQRDGLVGQLANLVGASGDSNGNVSIGGLPLVSGATALTLSTTGSGTSIALQITLPQGVLPLGQVGGEIGGVETGMAVAMGLRNNLNSFVTSVANAINGQVQQGFGLDGSNGTPLFMITNGIGPISMNPAMTAQKLGAASGASGVPGDGSNAAAVAALASAAGADSSFPSSTLGQAFAQVASQFGQMLQTAQSNQTQLGASLNSLNQLKGSITGVSLNDQLSKLIQYQDALQAAGKAVQASNDILTFLIQEL